MSRTRGKKQEKLKVRFACYIKNMYSTVTRIESKFLAYM